MLHQLRLLLSFGILITLLATVSGLGEPISEDIESALLAQDWETARALLESYDLETDSVAAFIHNHCCLALDLECVKLSTVLSPHGSAHAGAIEAWVEGFAAKYPENAVSWWLLGAYRKAQGESGEAKEALDRSLRKDYKFVPALIERGTLEAWGGSESRMRHNFQRALTEAPTHSIALLNFGACLDESGQSELALKMYDRGLATGKHAAQFNYNKGNTLRTLNRDAEAVVCFTAAIAHDSSLLAARYNRGNTYRDLGKIDSALADYRYVVDHAGTTDAYMVRTLEPLVTGMTDSIAIYDSLAVTDYIAQARLYFRHAEIDRAIEAASAAIQRDSLNPAGYYWRAKAFDGLGVLDSAIADYSRALALDRSNRRAWYHRGVCYSRLGDYVAAQADFNGALERDSTFAEAYRERGWVNDQLRNFEEARRDYEKYAVLRTQQDTEGSYDIDRLLDQLIWYQEAASDYYARNQVERAYEALANQDWKTLLTCVSSQGLKQFRSNHREYLDTLVADGDTYIRVGRKMLDVERALIGTPTEFLTNYLYVRNLLARERDPSFSIDSVKVVDARCFARDKFLVRSRLFVTALEEQHVILGYDVIAKYDRRWAFESCNSWDIVFDFDQALAYRKLWGRDRPAEE